jgi:hypothetical protein
MELKQLLNRWIDFRVSVNFVGVYSAVTWHTIFTQLSAVPSAAFWSSTGLYSECFSFTLFDLNGGTKKKRLPQEPRRPEDNIKIDLANGGRCSWQPQFPRIVIRLSWTRGTEWSGANWGNGNGIPKQLVEDWEIQLPGDWASQSPHSFVAA